MSGPSRRLILLAPIQPFPTGNGLAMRAALFRRAAASEFDVHTVVVPVAGRVAAPQTEIIVAPYAARARSGAIALVAQPRWRRRIAQAGTLPPLARAASPGLVDTVAARLAGREVTGVHVMRSYLAPLGAAVAECLDAEWVTLDLDEDDAAFCAATGDVEGARAYERLLDAFGDCFDGLSAASALDAAAIAARHGLTVEHIPNAVDLPPGPVRRRRDASALSLLFVGNLTYAPNIEAVHALAEQVAPRVRGRLERRVRVSLVGPHRADLYLHGGDVEIAGYVPDLAPVYAAADVVAVPLRAGAGTRIKLLEAFAHRVPVVASPAAAAGLDVSDGRHLLLAEHPEQMAAAVAAIATDDALAARLVDEAATLVRDRYSTEAVIPLIRDFVGRAERFQPSAAR